MKFSAKARYGLKAMYYLGLNYGEKLSINRIASLTGVMVPYLEKIMRSLKKGGFVSSERGTSGGYYLCYPPEFITIGQILKVLEEDLFTSECVKNHCTDKNCPNKLIFKTIHDGINDFLHKLTLKEMISNNTTNGEKSLGCN